MYLPAEDFSEIRCDEGTGWNERPMNFKFYVEGTEKEHSRSLSVTYLPKYEVTSVEGPPEVSIGVGGNPYYEVEGVNMYYSKIRFAPTSCNVPMAESAIENAGVITDYYQITIPLSLLQPCSYSVWLVTPCDVTKQIASLKVLP